jgi:hypothetical protein
MAKSDNNFPLRAISRESKRTFFALAYCRQIRTGAQVRTGPAILRARCPT